MASFSTVYIWIWEMQNFVYISTTLYNLVSWNPLGDFVLRVQKPFWSLFLLLALEMETDLHGLTFLWLVCPFSFPSRHLLGYITNHSCSVFSSYKWAGLFSICLWIFPLWVGISHSPDLLALLLYSWLSRHFPWSYVELTIFSQREPFPVSISCIDDLAAMFLSLIP